MWIKEFIKNLFKHKCSSWEYLYSDTKINGRLTEIEMKCAWCKKRRKIRVF